jgi:hypothetical protein
MSRINDIETRLSAIATEIEAEGADVNALAKETDELMEERQALLDEIETRKATLAKVASLPEKELEPVINKETEMEEKRTFAVDSAEYREIGCSCGDCGSIRACSHKGYGQYARLSADCRMYCVYSDSLV